MSFFAKGDLTPNRLKLPKTLHIQIGMLKMHRSWSVITQRDSKYGASTTHVDVPDLSVQ
jgi:hypothetical protein